MLDLLIITDASKPCSIGRQKKVSFVKISNPHRSGKSISNHSDVYSPTSFSSVGGSWNHARPIIGQRIVKCSGSVNLEKVRVQVIIFIRMEV